jgi:FKBP-type peptidyl-prolyl cis-trans isomerase 2
VASSALVKALSLVLFVAAVAGATYGVMGYMGDTVRSIAVGSPHATLNATGGHNVTFIVTLTNRESAQREVSVEAVGVIAGKSDLTTVRGNSNASVFLTVHVPTDVEVGEHLIDVRVMGDGETLRERDGLLHINILPASEGFAAGDSARATYTGRLSATGRVFNTNDRGLVGLSFPKTEGYRFTEGLLDVQTRPRLTIVPGLAQGMLGIQPGESRTVAFPSELGYGPATINQTFPRDDTLNRTLTVRNEDQSVARETFDSYINETGQGDPSTMTVGIKFDLEEEGNLWPYRITNLSDQVVSYKLAADVGTNFTVYPFWPSASTVLAIDDEKVVFFTTPTTAPLAENFTFKAYWPEMSTLLSVNETHMVIRNTPAVGFAFTQVAGNAPREFTIIGVGDTLITAALPSQNPLAGKDLTFDVTLLTLTKPTTVP